MKKLQLKSHLGLANSNHSMNKHRANSTSSVDNSKYR